MIDLNAVQSIGAQTDAITKSQRHTAYSNQVAREYNYRYGKDHPFLPSNIQTTSGEFYSPKDFPTAKYCGHCHQATHSQWRQSAHSNSNRAPWYLKNVYLLDAQKGVEFSRHCEGCHDPIATVAGALTEGAPKTRPYDQDGITCSVCHAIKKVETRGTGSFTLGVPAVLLDKKGDPIRRPVSDQEILANLDRHRAAVMKDFYRTSEFCAACHKAALPKTLNGYKWQRAISLYDEWQNSSFSKQSPLTFYTKNTVSTCQDCHMQPSEFDRPDYGASGGQLASHRWLGANTIVPQYYGFPEQMSKVVAFLKSSVLTVDIFAVELVSSQPELSRDKKVIAPLGSTQFELKPGVLVTVSVVIQNKGIAHSLVPEQRDMYESWVDFVVKDGSGNVLAESGALQSDGTLDPTAHTFTSRLINKEGTLNGRHEVWNNRVIAYNNTIQSGRSQLVRYSFRMPDHDVTGIVVTATVRYRRFDQQFIDFGMKSGYVQPIVDLASASRSFRAGINQPAPQTTTGNPDWMRWNNYGIALLDAQQYAASVEAFRQVVALEPDYADGHTNVAIGEILSEKYDAALPELMKSLTLSYNNARALYYLALVKRATGDSDGAIADLKTVAQMFPRSRDVHRELGFSYYQRHDYELARSEYETVQGIDPDDLASHYNLSILYRRVGMEKQSLEESTYFADQKPDPSATIYALQYFNRHREMALESSPYHVHDLDLHVTSSVATGAAAAKRLHYESIGDLTSH